MREMHLHMSQLLGHNQPVLADKRLARGAHSSLAIGRKGDITGAGMTAVEGPLGLTVTDDENAGCSHGYGG